MSTEEICPICNNPKSSTPGSMTQWISACTCDSVPLDDEEIEQIKVNICKTCGKRIGEGRSGSFTQFIFRSDTCQCKRPVFDNENDYIDINNQETTAQDLDSTASEVKYEDSEEKELQLDEPGKFPIERYKPVKLLGSGSTGSVYLARDNLLNKRVSVKILSEFNSKALVAFQNEAKNTVQLNHPSIIEILDFGVTEAETPFMVLEYFPGLSLEEELEKKGTLDWEDVRAIFANICDAVAYANVNNIYHRDIKPSNILILDSNPENVRLIDFGIASIKDSSDGKSAPQDTELVGTPLYMSPEAGSGKPYDSRSEVYSLCCVLYKTFTGEPPFMGKTVLETLTMHKESPRPNLENPTNRQFLTELNELIQKGLAVNPNDRYINAKELKEELLSIKTSDITINTTVKEIEREKASDLKHSKSLIISSVYSSVIGLCLVAAYILFVSPDITSNQKVEPVPIVEVIKEKSEIPHEKIVIKAAEEMDWFGKKWSYVGHEIKGVEVVDADFKKLKLSPKTTFIRINGASTSFTGTGFKYLINHPFRKIEISAMAFNDDGAKQVSNFDNLFKLLVQHNHALTIKGIEYLSKMKNLKTLSFRFMTIPEGTAELIAKSKFIKTVELGHIQNLTKKDIEIICAMPQLKGLLIAGAKVDDSIIPILMKKQLSQLSINGTNITGAGLMELAKMKSLGIMKISTGDGITMSDYKKFKRIRKDCAVKVDTGFNLGKGTLQEIKKLTLPKSLK